MPARRRCASSLSSGSAALVEGGGGGPDPPGAGGSWTDAGSLLDFVVCGRPSRTEPGVVARLPTIPPGSPNTNSDAEAVVDVSRDELAPNVDAVLLGPIGGIIMS